MHPLLLLVGELQHVALLLSYCRERVVLKWRSDLVVRVLFGELRVHSLNTAISRLTVVECSFFPVF